MSSAAMAIITRPQGSTRHLKTSSLIFVTYDLHSTKIGNYYYRSKNWTVCNNV